MSRHAEFPKVWLGETVSLIDSQVTLLALPLTASIVERRRRAAPRRVLHLKVVFTKRGQTRPRDELAPLPTPNPQPDGSLQMTLDVGGLLEITPWLLGWGSAVEVLDPPELRETMRQIAGHMIERYMPVQSP